MTKETRERPDKDATTWISKLSSEATSLLSSEAVKSATEVVSEHSTAQNAVMVAGVVVGACVLSGAFLFATSKSRNLLPRLTTSRETWDVGRAFMQIAETPKALKPLLQRVTNRSGSITAASIEEPPIFSSAVPLDASGRLPVGRYNMTWSEFSSNFVTNDHRRRLSEGMLSALNDLRKAGSKEVEVGGSFVSKKAEPGDFDLVWNAQGVKRSRLTEGLRYDSHRHYGGHIFEAESPIYGLKGVSSSTQLIRTARGGGQFGTVLIDLTKDLPKAKQMFETFSP